MDSNFLSAQKIFSLFQSRRFQGLVIGCLILAALAILQAGNLRGPVKMCELFETGNASEEDLQRMQIAFGKSGLNEFNLIDGNLMVPKTEHAKYLQSLADHDGIPQDLRDRNENLSTTNPFLSRSQQLSIERAQKKRQIRDMVVRLPFVDQAWFEMDQTTSRSAFQRSAQTAVISIRPATDVTLNENHVDTVKRMIGGAIAGLDLGEIVVIDLSAGYAHQDSTDPATTQQVRFQRIAFEQQRIYQSRIREALKDYPGIEVSVQVDVSQAPPKVDKVAVQPALEPQRIAVPPAKNIYDAGANGTAKLDDFEATERPIAPTPIALVKHVAAPEVIEKDISVYIDVPRSLVHDIYGTPAPIANSSGSTNTKYEHQAALARDTQKKFAQLKSEIVRKVQPLLPRNHSNYAKDLPITVNLIRQSTVVQAPAWHAKLKAFALQNWPSAAVLALGLILLSIVTRKPVTLPASPQVQYDDDQVLLSSEVRLPENGSEETADNSRAEVRLSNLIEKDPNAAAKVIETWIRDAA